MIFTLISKWYKINKILMGNKNDNKEIHKFRYEYSII